MTVATPASVATVSVSVDGRPVPAAVRSSITDVEVSHRAGSPSSFALSLYRPDGRPGDTGPLEVGAQVTVALGYAGGQMTRVFRGRVTTVATEFPADEEPLVRVEGFDPLHDLTQRTGRRIFAGEKGEGIKDSEIVQKIAQEHRLKCSAPGTEKRDRPRVQANVTDLAFLEEMAAVHDRDVFIDPDGQLVFGTLRDDQTPPFRLARGDNLIAFTARESQVGQVSGVEVRAWDARRQQAVTRTSGGTSGELLVVDDASIAGAAEAQTLADVLLATRRAARVTARCSLLGTPQVTVGRLLSVSGVGPHAGRYVTVEVTHRMSTLGFRTELRARRLSDREPSRARRIGDVAGWSPGPARVALGLVAGVVTDVVDPLQLGRVLVKFPLLGDDVRLWAQVALPGAGDRRGAHILPAPGDEVVVGFQHGDPSRPWVLGGLWTDSAKPPAVGSVDGKDRSRADVWLVRTTSGHELRMDDTSSHAALDLLDAKGNGLSIDTEKGTVTLHASSELVLDLPDAAFTVKAKTLGVTASGAAKVSAGSDGMTVEASGGSVTITGKDVNIN